MIDGAWKRTNIEFDPYGVRWVCEALAPHDGKLYWYKGTGQSQESAIADCRLNWAAHKHLGLARKPTVHREKINEAIFANVDLSSITLNL